MERALDPSVTRPLRTPATIPSLPLRSFLNPPTHPVKNVSKGLRRLTLGGTRQSSGLALAASFHSSTLYLTLECQLLAFGFGLLRVTFSWSHGIYLCDEGLLLECVQQPALQLTSSIRNAIEWTGNSWNGR